MIKLLEKVPKDITIALSGGPDSMTALSFLQRSNRCIDALYFDHGTTHAKKAEAFVTNYCESNSIPLKVGRIQREKAQNESKEEYWRNERYSFFKEATKKPIILGHHLDDAMEWWIFSSLNGMGKLIPYANQKTNVLRPLLLNRKRELLKWLKKNNVPYIEDPSNSSTEYTRNYIRHNLMQHAIHVNPGLAKVIAKKYIDLHK
jgi:tRNA(Ile)-lysidine synthase